MDNNNFFTGILKTENSSMPVEIHYASKFSIFVKYDNLQSIKDGNIFTSLSIDTGSSKYELGNCRFILETDIHGINGRLVFVNDIYNFDALFRERDFINLERLSKDLSLVLNHKNRVREDLEITRPCSPTT